MNDSHNIQLFATNTYFENAYPMYSKRKDGDALNMLCQEFGVPQKQDFDGSKEQAYKGTKFMKEVHRKGINYHIRETDIYNHNSVEGVITEVRRKWYCAMVEKRLTMQL